VFELLKNVSSWDSSAPMDAQCLRQSTRATLTQYSGKESVPPIRVTVVENSSDVLIRVSDQGKHYVAIGLECRSSGSIGGGLDTAAIGSPSNLFSFSHLRNSSRMDLSRLDTLRSVSEASSRRRPEMWFRETPPSSEDVESEASAGTHVRMGIGLPLSNIFATCVLVICR
jgi:pyruvate dehydrogenase kinase 2/3/4